MTLASREARERVALIALVVGVVLGLVGSLLSGYYLEGQSVAHDGRVLYIQHRAPAFILLVPAVAASLLFFSAGLSAALPRRICGVVGGLVVCGTGFTYYLVAFGTSS